MWDNVWIQPLTEQESRDFYDANPESFVTHVPLMRGRYIRISDNSPNLNPIRSLYRSRSIEDIDRLDQLCHTSAEKYWVFDDWVSLDALLDGTGMELAEMAAVLEAKLYVEKSYLGYSYLIAVDGYVPAGRVAPYSYCTALIRDAILSRRKQALLTSLERNLLNDAIASEKLKIYTKE